MCVADALHSAGFLLHAALSEGQGQQWWTPLRGQEEGGRKARLGRQMCGEEGLSLPGSRELQGSVTWQSIPTESVLPLRAGHSHRCLDVTWSAGMLCLSLLES